MGFFTGAHLLFALKPRMAGVEPAKKRKTSMKRFFFLCQSCSRWLPGSECQSQSKVQRRRNQRQQKLSGDRWKAGEGLD